MLIQADARALPLPDRYVQTVITSPPYYGLRDYGVEGQIGLEKTPQEYVEQLVTVFREVRRVLRDDGTVWLNISDSYARSPAKGGSGPCGKNEDRWGYGAAQSAKVGSSDGAVGRADRPGGSRNAAAGLDAKQLLGIPWRVAFALQADGWYLRSDIIWAKGRSFDPDGAGSCMPESVRDRPTRGHEYVFLLTKQERYFYDFEAVKEPGAYPQGTRAAKGSGTREGNRRPAEYAVYSGTRNLRSVWVINPQPFKGAHFATFPEKLAETCLLAGSPPSCCPRCGAPHQRIIEKGQIESAGPRGVETERKKDADGGRVGASSRTQRGDFQDRWDAGITERRTIGWRATCGCDHGGESSIPVVLDPFCGSGTVGVVCKHHGRFFIGCDLKPEYLRMAQCRIEGTGC